MDYAHELLEELHPLEKTPLREAFPWLGTATCYSKQSGSASQVEVADHHSQLLEKKKSLKVGGKEIVKKSKKKKKNPLDAKVQDANPLAKLGFGIVAYIGMLWCLIWTFLLYTLLLIPTMNSFSSGTAYSGVPEAIKSSYLDGYLGNMGYSSVQCTQIPTDVGRLAIACPYGTIGEFLSYGVNPLAENKFDCMTNEANKGCTPDSASISDVFSKSVGLDSYLFDFTGKSLYTSASTEASCTNASSTFFVQYTCVQAVDDQSAKFDQMSLAVATGVLICLLFTLSIR